MTARPIVVATLAHLAVAAALWGLAFAMVMGRGFSDSPGLFGEAALHLVVGSAKFFAAPFWYLGPRDVAVALLVLLQAVNSFIQANLFLAVVSVVRRRA